ncbi:hypothetical protein X975_19933, partial [Stegodyphus mimosarum]
MSHIKVRFYIYRSFPAIEYKLFLKLNHFKKLCYWKYMFKMNNQYSQQSALSICS